MARTKSRSNAFADANWEAVPRTDDMGGQALTDAVVASLVRCMEERRIKSGDRLPSEWELCERFGVSRTVIREAVASLRAQGLVESRRGSGVFVRATAARSSWVDLQAGERLSDVLDILELRIAVEVESAGLAAERRSEAMLLEVYDSLQAFRAATRRRETSAELDFAFHRAIAVATGNAQFVRLIEQLREQLIPRQVLGPKFATAEQQDSYGEQILAEHDAIYQSIADRDGAAAKENMRLHLDGSRKRYRNWRFQIDSSAARSGGHSNHP